MLFWHDSTLLRVHSCYNSEMYLNCSILSKYFLNIQLRDILWIQIETPRTKFTSVPLFTATKLGHPEHPYISCSKATNKGLTLTATLSHRPTLAATTSCTQNWYWWLAWLLCRPLPEPDHIYFLNFPVGFSIPIIFSNFDYNFSNVFDLKNLQEQVKKGFHFKHFIALSLFEYVDLIISKILQILSLQPWIFFFFSITGTFFSNSRSEEFWKQNTTTISFLFNAKFRSRMSR